MSKYDTHSEELYLSTVLRMAERHGLLQVAGMDGWHFYFNRSDGYENHDSPTAKAVAKAVATGAITAEQAMDLEMAALMAGGRTKHLKPNRTEYCVVETTTTDPAEAAANAKRRGQILAQAMSDPVYAVVVTTETALGPAHRRAPGGEIADGVTVIEFNPGGHFG